MGQHYRPAQDHAESLADPQLFQTLRLNDALYGKCEARDPEILHIGNDIRRHAHACLDLLHPVLLALAGEGGNARHNQGTEGNDNNGC